MRRHEKDTRCKWNMTYCGFSPRPLHSLYSAFAYHRPVSVYERNGSEARQLYGILTRAGRKKLFGITPLGEKLSLFSNYHLKRRRFVLFPRTNDPKGPGSEDSETLTTPLRVPPTCTRGLADKSSGNPRYGNRATQNRR